MSLFCSPLFDLGSLLVASFRLSLLSLLANFAGSFLHYCLLIQVNYALPCHQLLLQSIFFCFSWIIPLSFLASVKLAKLITLCSLLNYPIFRIWLSEYCCLITTHSVWLTDYWFIDHNSQGWIEFKLVVKMAASWCIEKRGSIRNDSFRDNDNIPETGCLSIIVLGASGDLAKKKTFPALFNLYRQVQFTSYYFCSFVG